MKKTFTGRLRFLVVAMLATITFSFNSCRKDLLVQGPNNLKNALSIAEAKSYFEAHVVAKGVRKKNATPGTMTAETFLDSKSPIWQKAYEKVISTGTSVKVPIDFGKAYAVVDPVKDEVVPLNALNYLFMYRDSLQAIHAEWVILQPDSAWLYGNRNRYTGRIIVKDWNGRAIRNLYYRPTETSGVNGKLSSTGKSQSSGGTNKVNDVVGFCVKFADGRCPKLAPCNSSYCDLCLERCAKLYCNFFDCSPACDLPSEPGVGGGGDGGGNGNPSSPGGGGVYPPEPCDGGGLGVIRGNTDDPTMAVPLPPCIPKPLLLQTVDRSTLMGKLGILPESVEAIYLSNHPEVVSALLAYLTTNGETPENVEFLKWAMGYLMVNKNISLGHLEGIYQIQIDPNYIPRDREPSSYYWRTRLSDSNGYDNFGAYLVETTPYYIYLNGEKTINLEAYNCHYYVFGLTYASEVAAELPKWVLNVKIDTKDWELVKGRVKVGDRIIYQANTNGRLTFTHSAVVTEVDADGYATKARSKMSYFEIIEHHPRDMPVSYGSTNATFTIVVPAAGNNPVLTETHQSRLYWRKK